MKVAFFNRIIIWILFTSRIKGFDESDFENGDLELELHHGQDFNRDYPSQLHSSLTSVFTGNEYKTDAGSFIPRGVTFMKNEHNPSSISDAFISNGEPYTPLDIKFLQDSNDYSSHRDIFAPESNDFTLQNNIFSPKTNQFTTQNNIFTPKSNDYTHQTSTYTPKSNDFSPENNVFAPKSNNDTPKTNIFTPKSNNFTPENNIFAPKSNILTPENNAFTPKSNDFTPQSDAFTPTSNEFTPQRDVFTPKSSDFTSPGSDTYIPRSDAFDLRKKPSTPKEETDKDDDDTDSLDRTESEVFTPTVDNPVIYGGKNFVNLGDGFYITCSLISSNILYWTHNDEEIIPGEGGFNIVQGEDEQGFIRSKLSVVRSKVRHGGQYKCTYNSPRSHSVYVLNNDNSHNPPLRMYVGYKLVIVCNITGTLNPTLAVDWYKNGEPITEESDPRYEISNPNSTLVIEEAEETDVGVYTCRSKMDVLKYKNITVVFYQFKKMPKSTTVSEEDKIVLSCNVYGNPTPRVKWLREDAPIGDFFTKWEYTLSPNAHDIENGTLSIYKASKDMRGNYTCVIQLAENTKPIETTTYIRVKGIYAALYPFIGIVAEVVVLTFIILYYEKKRLANVDEADLEMTSGILGPSDRSRRRSHR